MKLYLLHIVFIFTVLTSIAVHAQENFKTPEELYQSAVFTVTDTTSTLAEKTKVLESIVRLAKKRSWVKVQTQTEVELLLLYGDLYRIKEQLALVESTMFRAQALNLNDELLLLKSIILSLNLATQAEFLTENYENEILASIDAIENERLRYQIERILAIYYVHNNELIKALLLNQKLLKRIGDTDKYTEVKSAVISSLGEIYYDIGQIEKSIQYINQTIQLAQSIGNLHDEATFRHNLISMLLDEKMVAEAKVQFPTWEQKLTELNDGVLWADFHRLKGHLQLLEKDFENATINIRKSINGYQKNKIEDFELLSQIHLIEIYIEQKRFNLARAIYIDNLDIVDLLGTNKDKFNHANLGVKIFEHYNDFERALMANRKASHYEKELLNIENKTKVQKIEYEQVIKESELDRIRMVDKARLHELETIQQKQNTTILMLVGLLLIFVLFIVCYMLYKQYIARKSASLLANTDPLTGAPNRRSIMEDGDKALVRCKLKKERFTIAIADIDHFKTFNDTFGHQIGDEVLVYFSENVQDILNENEYFGRIGGEEWLFVLSNAPKEQATLLFERLCRFLNLINKAVDVGKYKVTVSMGVAELENNEGLADLIKKADEKLYEAKIQGRDRVVF